jgi:rsbT co-antagonist protein RsbR
MVALLSFLGARSISGAFQAASTARAQAELSAEVLEYAKEELEVMVTERTAALQDALAEVQARADVQARLLAEVEQQRNIIREISVPVIPISKTALVIPLVGALDSARMLRVQEQALRSIERSSARHVVLDITGVPIVDSQVAEGLMSVMAAARLLGAQVMLVGIRPEVAQSIVGLALDLRGIYTASDLQSALRRITLNHAV